MYRAKVLHQHQLIKPSICGGVASYMMMGVFVLLCVGFLSVLWLLRQKLYLALDHHHHALL